MKYISNNQGAASNHNGIALEYKVKRLLERAGVPYEQQVKRYPGLNPDGHKHDFIATIRCVPTVIECKSFSGMAGSIWQKLPYAIHVLIAHRAPAILLLGGKVPNDWRIGYLRSLGTKQVAIMTLKEFSIWLSK